MTTANEVDMDALKAQAKELKIKGYGLIKDPGKLQDKINAALAEENEVVEEKPKRSKAPKMSLEGITTNNRRKYLDKLDAADPECKHLLQPIGITAEELKLKGLEPTGETWRNNVVCRTDKQGYNDYMAEKRQKRRRMMDAIDVEQKYIKSHTESPKEGT